LPCALEWSNELRQRLKKLWHQLGSPRWFYQISGAWPAWLLALGLTLIAVGWVWGLAYAPPDYQQGNSFRIMYVHVPASMLAQSCYLLLGVAGAVLLIWRMKLADMVIAVAAPIGVGFVALSLITGVLWGKPTWLQASDRWWVWDARTTSMLVLLFLYFGIIALRQSIARQESAGRACAVLAVVGLINIPIIKYSVDWWLTLHQPATFTLTEKPAMPAEMWLPLLFSALGFYVFFAAILTIALRTEILLREQRTQWVRDLAGGMLR